MGQYLPKKDLALEVGHAILKGGAIMIWRPKVGQRVRINYRKSLRTEMPCQDRTGIIERVAGGPGPISALVRLEHPGCGGGQYVIVPRGYLVAVRQ
ncbi:MAG: hypothetical protein ACOWWM_15400 [Desulfobacterales bacterium]